MFSNLDNQLVRSAQWHKLASGSSNKIYSATVAQQRYVLRINASTEYAFGVSREREAKVLALIQGQPWAPTIIENNLSQGWCLMLHQGDEYTETVVAKAQILKLLREMQLFSKGQDETAIESIHFDYRGLFNSYREKLSQRRGNDLGLQLCALLYSALQQLPAVDAALIHQDLHPKNICCPVQPCSSTVQPAESAAAPRSQLVAIDWEYGGWGNPWLDLAAVHQAFAIDADALQQTPLFNRMPAQQFTAGLSQAIEINTALACIWYWMRSELALKNAIEQGADQSFAQRSQLEGQARQCIAALS